MNEDDQRALVERALRWWLAYPGRHLIDRSDRDELERSITEGLDEFFVYQGKQSEA